MAKHIMHTVADRSTFVSIEIQPGSNEEKLINAVIALHPELEYQEPIILGEIIRNFAEDALDPGISPELACNLADSSADAFVAWKKHALRRGRKIESDQKARMVYSYMGHFARLLDEQVKKDQQKSRFKVSSSKATKRPEAKGRKVGGRRLPAMEKPGHKAPCFAG